MNHYEEKRQARIDRLRDRAQDAKRESDAAFDQAHRMASVIPFGQPILVGHHSEGRDRRYRGRIHNKLGKAIEEQNKAEYYAQRVAAAESNTAISSDDPEAVVKLREKLADLEKLQETMKAVNAAHKKFLKNAASLDKSPLPNEMKTTIRNYTPKYSWEPHPYPPYAMTNNGAEIRRCKQRIEQLLEAAKQENKEYEVGRLRIHENIDENRLQLFFPDKPSEEIRSMLKGRGFHWSHYNGAWQRQLNNGSRYALKDVLEKIAPMYS